MGMCVRIQAMYRREPKVKMREILEIMRKCERDKDEWIKDAASHQLISSAVFVS